MCVGTLVMEVAGAAAGMEAAVEAGTVDAAGTEATVEAGTEAMGVEAMDAMGVEVTVEATGVATTAGARAGALSPTVLHSACQVSSARQL